MPFFFKSWFLVFFSSKILGPFFNSESLAALPIAKNKKKKIFSLIRETERCLKFSIFFSTDLSFAESDGVVEAEGSVDHPGGGDSVLLVRVLADDGGVVVPEQQRPVVLGHEAVLNSFGVV